MFDKRSCFSRARALLATNDDEVLRYACLELRFCIEAVTYDKLRTYAARLPPRVIETWQPPQAMKALRQIEPGADHDFTLRVCRESEPGTPSGDWVELGSHASLKLPWLRKTYNKLGSYLHVPSPSAQELRPPSASPETIRGDLERILADLEPVVHSKIDSSMALVVSFVCTKCGATIPCNSEGLSETGRVQCLNPKCGASFVAEVQPDGEFLIRLDVATIQCLACDQSGPVEKQKLEVGYSFPCPNCGALHQIVEQVWAFTLASELQSEG
jgi:predicted RNA-binding Zn-ribbon protein involved in translation (DUF1610 family)